MTRVTEETRVAGEVRPLVAGDNLTRAEFLRIWEQHPEIKRAELLGDIVFMPSPVSPEHGDEEVNLGGLFFLYEAHTPGCEAGYNTTTLMLSETPQPDLNLRILPECGGASWVEDNLLAGASLPQSTRRFRASCLREKRREPSH